jgi:putative ABC transport system permease protein
MLAWLAGLGQDVRIGFRMLLRTPSATAMATLALALGIGVNVTTYAALRAMVLEPLAVPDAGRVVQVSEVNSSIAATRNNVSMATFLDWRDHATAFERLAAYVRSGFRLGGTSTPELLQACLATRELFRLLRVEAAPGRAFDPSVDSAAGDNVAVISHGLWQRRLGGDPAAIGTTLVLDDRPHTILGVMPDSFDFPPGTEVWTPLPERPGPRGARSVFVLGRLGPDVSLARAQAEMDSIARNLATQHPDSNHGWGARVERLVDIVNPVTDRFVIVQTIAAVLVLLLAVANVANIQLVRALRRRQELALRTALGADRLRLTQHVVVECLLVALAGGSLGLVLASWNVSAFRTQIPEQVYHWVAGMRNFRVGLDALPLTLAVALAVGLFSSLPGVLEAVRRRDLRMDLGSDGKGALPSGGTMVVRRTLVVAEVALAMVLLAGAGIMVRSYREMTRFDLGFEPKRLITFGVALPETSYPADAVLSYQDEARRRLEALPQVESAAVAAGLWGGIGITELRVQGEPPPPRGTSQPDLTYVSPGFSEAMDLSVLEGRAFTDEDAADRPPRVAMVSQAVARRFWGEGRSPVGSELQVGGYGFPTLRVIGVVEDMRDWFQHKPQPKLYVCHTQSPQRSSTFIARTRGPADQALAATRETIQGLDRTLPIQNLRTMEQQHQDQTSGVRMAALNMTTYAGLALLLAVTGVYGVVSFAVAQRTREMGVRLALGASRERVIRLIVGQAMSSAGFGIILGFLAAVALTRAMASALYETLVPSAVELVLLALALCAVAGLAAYVPVQRALAGDPMKALRHE